MSQRRETCDSWCGGDTDFRDHSRDCEAAFQRRRDFAARIENAHEEALHENEARLAALLQADRGRGGGTHYAHIFTERRIEGLEQHDDPWPGHPEERTVVNAFHWRGGLFFVRVTCDCVAIVEEVPYHDPTFPGRRCWRRHVIGVIDPDAWASIVASVSKKGETGERWQHIREFHGRPPKGEQA